MAYNSRLDHTAVIQVKHNLALTCRFFFHPDLPDAEDSITRITVGAVIATAHAFRLADFTADRDSHPALKICGCKCNKIS